MNLIELLKRFSIDEVLYYEENYDKQYIYLRNLYNKINNRDIFLKIIVINSLLAFQLIYKGELFWKKFSDYFSINYYDIYNDFIDFIYKYNSRLKETKVKRLDKIYNWIKDKDLLIYKDNLLGFNNEIASVMGQNYEDKTIVFSTKIFGYGLRIIGYKIIYPYEIYIPVDNRISKISKDKKFWISLSKEVNIPLLHIDSVIWITMGIDRKEINNINNKSFKEKIEDLKDYLDSIIKY
ncbi:N-glycosylase/DNA lyase [Nanobdella aerobiophila]|uniref:N-glycosylase/DNA lyase n=1 Tax=Nanobdella aerobiophila TaxID=2586965 RepID=A0A915WRT5_9ARCH|nr:N-glycosylase/DNA lyase [Nanobdella aerobiophila]BBL45579.1 N-glycosylase/DNA lyase [Nanobdella aerobiophila]